MGGGEGDREMSQRNILAFFKPKNAAVQTQPENAMDGNQRSRGKDDLEEEEEEEKHERTDGGSCVHHNQGLGKTASTTRTRTTMRDRTEDVGARLECDPELGDQEAVGRTLNIDHHDESALIKRRKRNCGEAVAAGLESFALPSDRRRSDTSAGGETVATYETGSQRQRLHDVGSPEDGTPSRTRFEQRHEDMDEFGFISGASTSEVKLTPLESQILSLKKRYQKHRGKATTDVGDIEDIDVLFIEVTLTYQDTRVPSYSHRHVFLSPSPFFPIVADGHLTSTFLVSLPCTGRIQICGVRTRCVYCFAPRPRLLQRPRDDEDELSDAQGELVYAAPVQSGPQSWHCAAIEERRSRQLPRRNRRLYRRLPTQGSLPPMSCRRVHRVNGRDKYAKAARLGFGGHRERDGDCDGRRGSQAQIQSFPETIRVPEREDW